MFTYCLAYTLLVLYKRITTTCWLFSLINNKTLSVNETTYSWILKLYNFFIILCHFHFQILPVSYHIFRQFYAFQQIKFQTNFSPKVYHAESLCC